MSAASLYSFPPPRRFYVVMNPDDPYDGDILPTVAECTGRQDPVLDRSCEDPWLGVSAEELESGIRAGLYGERNTARLLKQLKTLLEGEKRA